MSKLAFGASIMGKCFLSRLYTLSKRDWVLTPAVPCQDNISRLHIPGNIHHFNRNLDAKSKKIFEFWCGYMYVYSETVLMFCFFVFSFLFVFLLLLSPFWQIKAAIKKKSSHITRLKLIYYWFKQKKRCWEKSPEF